MWYSKLRTLCVFQSHALVFARKHRGAGSSRASFHSVQARLCHRCTGGSVEKVSIHTWQHDSHVQSFSPSGCALFRGEQLRTWEAAITAHVAAVLLCRVDSSIVHWGTILVLLGNSPSGCSIPLNESVCLTLVSPKACFIGCYSLLTDFLYFFHQGIRKEK